MKKGLPIYSRLTKLK